MDPAVIIGLALEAAFAFGLLWWAGALPGWKERVCCGVLVVCAFAVRAAGFDHASGDYNDFLAPWVEYFRTNGGFAALDRQIGNYNVPYLYFLALFSYSKVSDLYLIKLLSVLFDVVLAYAALRLAVQCTHKIKRGMAAFFVVLFLPTVVLNGSLWGQCDSIYVACAVLGISLALPYGRRGGKERCYPVFSMVAIACSLGFKLQAVFVLPFYLILWMRGYFRWYHFLAIPLAYSVLMLPAVAAGRDFFEVLLLYVSEAGTAGEAIAYNAPSLYALVSSTSTPAIVAAFVGMGAVLLAAFLLRKKLGRVDLLVFACLMVTVIPFLLPHMHDRYFLAADVLSVVLAVCLLPAIVPAVLTQFASLICYIAYLRCYYLWIGSVVLTPDKGAVALILALVAYVVLLAWRLGGLAALRTRFLQRRAAGTE